MNTANAEKVYEAFSGAVKAKDQTCVNTLSSSYFKQQQTTMFSTSTWITKSADGQPSTSADLSLLPGVFNVAAFTSGPYTRTITETQGQPFVGSSSPEPTGLTLGYKISEPGGSEKYDLQISFVRQNGELLVDAMVQVPVSIEQFEQSH